nr:MAG: ORF1 [TTV-like mini virus]
MYYRRNYYRRWRRPRRRRFRRRYFRRPFQRKYWRRRHYRVRKRKLKFLKLKEWQPHYIRRCKVTGIQPLFLTTSERLAHNMTCYLETTAPHLYPGGGGFSIQNFTLNMLYEQNLIAKNWWSQSNDNLPLIRYTGCTIWLYRQSTVDYLFHYRNAYPMTAKLLTYTSTHPQAMLMTKHTKKILCKQYNRNKKPYKKIRITPPSQMQNKWFFQKDIAHIPLLQTICTAASLDRMFLNSSSISTTIGFTSLDRLGFINHNYSKMSTTGYIAIPNTLTFGALRKKASITAYKISELSYLGNPENLTTGTTIGNIPESDYNKYNGTLNTLQKKIKAAQQIQKHWGNPFDVIFHREGALITTNLPWSDIIEKYKDDKYLQSDHFTFKTHTFIDCRYNPFADKGTGNKLYLINLQDITHQTDWDWPEKDTLYENLPLYLMTWGYLDYMKKCGEYSIVDTKYLLVIYSPYIFPKDAKYYIPLDQDFLEGRSPYQEGEHVIAPDLQNWHPKVKFQTRTVNTIACSGPATAKLPPQISAEAHFKYQFHFKLGGEPPPMSVLTDPDDQPKYNIPNNILQPTSLQSPTTPLEYLLYKFDERRGTLTKKATQRIQKDQQTQQTVLEITEPTFACPISSQARTSEEETSDSEKEQMSTEERLQYEQQQQRLLRKRINKLLHRLAILE